MPDVVLVTGGTGLVGKGIDYIINTEPEGSRFGKKPGETWIFASSSEGDLRSVPAALFKQKKTPLWPSID
jgi:GDP-L-fucose synthase